MTSQPTEAIIAGSKAFALALLAPLTERVGTRPRIAADAAQAAKLAGGGGLVVVEFQGERSLEAIRALVGQSTGIAVIAAVPDAHAAAGEALRSIGVEAARWNGAPEDVLSAVSRRLAGAAAEVTSPGLAATAPVPAPAARPAPTAAPTPAASRVGALFDDLAIDEPQAEPLLADAFSVDVTAPMTAPVRPGSASAAAPAGPWPAGVPGAVEAADALGQGLQGIFAPDGAPLAVVAGVMTGLSPLERAVLVGEPQPIDTEPIRRAAVMRVRVAAALATAPTPGAPVDAGAVSALLADIDALLSDVNALVAGAPQELQPSLEQVRNALVKEAIDFSEAAHRAEPADAPAAARSGSTAADRRPSQSRGVRMASAAERAIEEAEDRRRRRLLALFAVAAIGAGAFHGWRFFTGRAGQAEERASRTGVPADARVIAAPLASAPLVVQSKDGKGFTPEELKRMQEEEAIRGNVVRESTPGTVVIVPAKTLGEAGGPVPPLPSR